MNTTEKDIINCAKNLLVNTKGTYLQAELNCLIINEDSMANDNIYIVIKKICEDGFDIQDFGLTEIPHPDVYCFSNYENTKAFDVYINYFYPGEEVTIGYLNNNRNCKKSLTIKDAIERYVNEQTY